MRLSPHFTLRELEVTSTGLPNAAPPEAVDRLSLLCAVVLEPWRARVGALRVTSGYRSPAVNRKIRGSPTSQHMQGEAADVVPIHASLPDAWTALVELVTGADRLPVDQAIVYVRAHGLGWIHVSYTIDRAPRRELLVEQGSRYHPWEGWSGPVVG